MLQTLTSKWSMFAVALLTLALSGCGETALEDLGTITGTVKSGGEVCGNCLIVAFNPKTLLSQGCRVGESGTFELKEIPFGGYQIAVVQEPVNDAEEVFDKRIPKKYRDKSTSGLSVSITSAEPVVLNIEMK